MALHNYIHVLESSSHAAALKLLIEETLSSVFLNYLLNAINMVAFYNTEGQILTLPSFPDKQIYINACKNEVYF